MEGTKGNTQQKKQSDTPTPHKKPKKIKIPRRQPSIVIPEKKPILITADKTTCAECPCYPKEEPYIKPKKLRQCQQTPLTLYELAAMAVEDMKFPAAFNWSVEEVAEWMTATVGLPEYRECILDNHINGLRLLLLEDPSRLPQINIHNFDHIIKITTGIRHEFSTEFIRFARSIGLPPRKPLTHCTWFKSRTGPSWGIRQNWTRCDILRWMKILMPEPLYLDHWDLVWYMKPDFPKVKIARVKTPPSEVHIPHYKPPKDICREYLVPRKFRIEAGIPEEAQYIWMEHRPGSPVENVFRQVLEKQKMKIERNKRRCLISKDSTLLPKKIDLTGLSGRDLILARRKMPKPKFFC